MEMNVFIVEDDSSIFELLKERLEKWSLRVAGPRNFEDILEDFVHAQPHLVLLDIQLPRFDGFHWCRQIRGISKVPILFLSSRDHPMDMVMAMNMGADDYIQKPFNVDVLLAKVQALLRRTYTYGEESADVIEWNGALLQLNRGLISKGDTEVELTKNEFFILAMLVKAKNEIIPRPELIRRLWEDEHFVNDNTLTANMTRLRQKLAILHLEDAIVTKKGLGYMATTQ